MRSGFVTMNFVFRRNICSFRKKKPTNGTVLIVEGGQLTEVACREVVLG